MASTKAVDESKSADWKKGKVYFCCGNCAKAFADDKEKGALAGKANAQLVATKQYKQTACPISGAKLDDSTAIEVAGTKVAFCCNNAKAKPKPPRAMNKSTWCSAKRPLKKASLSKSKKKSSNELLGLEASYIEREC